MLVYVDSSGAITAMIEAASPPQAAPAGPGAPLWLDDARYAEVWHHPERYRIVHRQPVLLPFVTVTPTVASGTTTLTITLNNPPSPPPASVSVTVGRSSLAVSLSNNTGSMAFQVHPSLSAYACPVTVSASDVVGATSTIGMGNAPPVAIQAVAPTTSGDPYLIAPAGSSASGFLAAYHLGMDPTHTESALTIMTLIHAVDTLLAANTTVTPPSTWPAKQQAHHKWQHDITTLPNL